MRDLIKKDGKRKKLNTQGNKMKRLFIAALFLTSVVQAGTYTYSTYETLAGPVVEVRGPNGYHGMGTSYDTLAGEIFEYRD